jgi:type IV pilus assembly protein PilN
MIKINLLPREERRRRAPTSPLVYLAVLGAVVLAGGLAYGWYWLQSEVTAVEGRIAQTQAELKRYEQLAKQVDQYRAEKKLLEDKIKIIDTLVAAQGGPVRLLDEVSKALPGEVWLTAMNRTGKRLDVSGIAFSNFSVATFMTNLGKASSFIRTVDLVVSEKALVEQVPVEKFSITMEVKDGKG